MHSNQMMQNQQIVQAFEELHLTPSQIAEQLRLNEVAVKAVLMQSSQAYRQRAECDIDYNLSDREALEAKDVIVRLLRHSEDDHLKFKIARYILDDKKGRLDIGKVLGSVRMDVTVFNQYLIQARDSVNQSKLANSRPPAAAETQLTEANQLIEV